MKDIFESFIVDTLIAHRGLHNKDKGVPENSLLAFKKAIEKGYAIELDVQPLEDGTPVVFHDSKLARMTGQDGYINNLKIEDLINYKLLGTDELITTLEDVLKFIDGRTPILIEIKNYSRPGDFEKKILKLLKEYKGKTAIVSFNPYVLCWFKQKAPNIWRGQNASFFKGHKLSFIKKLIIKRLMLTYIASPNFISYDATNLPNKYTKKLSHLPLIAWTVKSEEEYLRVIKHCDNVIFEGFEPKN